MGLHPSCRQILHDSEHRYLSGIILIRIYLSIRYTYQVSCTTASTGGRYLSGAAKRTCEILHQGMRDASSGNARSHDAVPECARRAQRQFTACPASVVSMMRNTAVSMGYTFVRTCWHLLRATSKSDCTLAACCRMASHSASLRAVKLLTDSCDACFQSYGLQGSRGRVARSGKGDVWLGLAKGMRGSVWRAGRAG